MKHWGRQRAGCSLVAAGLGSALTLTVLWAHGADRSTAERELEQIRSAIASIQSEIRDTQRDRSAVSLALERHERAIDALTKERRRLATSATRLAEELGRLRDVRASLEVDLAREREALGQHLRVAYALGREDRLKLFLQRRDPGSIARLLGYHQHFTRQRRARIAALDNTMSRLQETATAIHRESRRLESVRDKQAQRGRALVAEREKREQALAALDAALADRSSRLASLERDRSRLEALINSLRDALADIPRELEPPRSFRSLRGRLPWPVRGGIVHRFGTNRPEAGLRWQGVVLEAPAGREVRAVAHGHVVFADWLRGFGLMLILDHGGGYMSLYGHNESLLREPGEWVSPGDPLATVGGSGAYFEIRLSGKPQDPARWCNTRARFQAAL